jgi:hypothetical protein
MRMVNWIGCIFAGGLAGCSLYPIPDDVMSINTEDIVRHARCEMRSAILEHMVHNGIIPPQFTDEGIRSQIKEATRKAKAKRPPLSEPEEKLLRLASVAVAHTFDFNIRERNWTDAGVGFRLPWTGTNVLDVGAVGALDLTRQGQRQFGAEVRWDELITRSDRCQVPWEQPGNIVYPLSGSIGVGRVVKTFIDIDDQGGAKDNFVDTLIFTTDVSGGANATVKLDPVPHQFQPVAASAAVAASRLDVHKMVVSLVFPRPSIPRFDPITGVTRVDGDLNAPFERPADWRARYNLCVADARTREDLFKQLRLQAPEVYCITYADEFVPRYGRPAERRLAVTITQSPTAQPGTPTETVPHGTRQSPTLQPVPRTEPGPGIRVPQTPVERRPNFRPQSF